MLLPLLILASLAYIIYGLSAVAKERRENDSPHPALKFLLAGGAPIVVAVTMTYLFIIVGVATTVQFNVGSPSRMNVWSTWVDLWPLFLFINAASALAQWIAIL